MAELKLEMLYTCIYLERNETFFIFFDALCLQTVGVSVLAVCAFDVFMVLTAVSIRIFWFCANIAGCWYVCMYML